MKIARLPNRVAVLPKRHPTGRKEIASAETAGISEFPTIRVGNLTFTTSSTIL
jgi:hypothetical protein